MPLALDHLVFAARTLDEGVAWCEAALGVLPEGGGQHVFMGTHNRVFRLGSAAFERIYFEIIAIDPSLPPPAFARWFDLDEPAVRRVLAHGPGLLHWAARCDDIAATRDALREGGIDCGEPRGAERMTPRGLLRWRMSVRADGHRALRGAAPALIEWRDAHPTDTLPDRGVTLESMSVGAWPEASRSMLPPAIVQDAAPGAAALRVSLAGSRGLVTLESIPQEA